MKMVTTIKRNNPMVQKLSFQVWSWRTMLVGVYLLLKAILLIKKNY